MHEYQKIILILLSIYIFIAMCTTFIPVDKYQNEYFNTIKNVINKPQEHFDKQIEYADYVEEHGYFPTEIYNKKPLPIITEKPAFAVTNKLERIKPIYIRDKNNPEILYPYQERKFLFFRF